MNSLGRLENGFLRTYLSYTEHTEVPGYFGLWSGISILSVCLGRKCLIEYWPTVYPNFYIFFVAQSALSRKSTAIGQAFHLLSRLDDPPLILPQKNTTEGLIKILQRVEEVDGKLKQAPAEGIVMPDELIVFLNRDAQKSGLIGFLTNIWDAQEREFVYYTKGGGKEVLIDPCLSILAGTTVNTLKESIPEEAVGGGFTSRVIFITADQSSRKISWPFKDAEILELEKRLVEDLNQVRKLRGPFLIEPVVREFFDDMYKEFLSKSSLVRSPTLSGYAGRRHIMLLKLAMCTSAGRTSSMIIDKGDLFEAEKILVNAEVLMPSITARLISNEVGENMDQILDYIKMMKSVTRSDITRKMANKLRSHELDEYLRTLQSMGKIVEKLGRGVTYEYLSD